MTKNDRSALSRRQKAALPIFASKLNVEEACNEVGVSRNTFYEWMKNDLFKSELDRLRNDIVYEAINKLKINTVKAAGTLISLLSHDDCPTLQRSVANDILGHVMKFMELKEVEQRLVNLERTIKE
jgi:hypothetical protein